MNKDNTIRLLRYYDKENGEVPCPKDCGWTDSYNEAVYRALEFYENKLPLVPPEEYQHTSTSDSFPIVCVYDVIKAINPLDIIGYITKISSRYATVELTDYGIKFRNDGRFEGMRIRFMYTSQYGMVDRVYKAMLISNAKTKIK